MGLTELTAPLIYPVTLAEAKAAIKVQIADEDAFVTQLIAGATKRIENWLGRPLIARDYRITLDCWPADQVISLPLRPVQSVDRVALVREDGSELVLGTASYRSDLSRGAERLYPVQGGRWPTLYLNRAGINIDFRAGFGTAATDIPADLRQAVLTLVAHYFEYREAENDKAELSLRRHLGANLSPYLELRI